MVRPTKVSGLKARAPFICRRGGCRVRREWARNSSHSFGKAKHPFFINACLVAADSEAALGKDVSGVHSVCLPLKIVAIGLALKL
jgi:hypothetical protein